MKMITKCLAWIFFDGPKSSFREHKFCRHFSYQNLRWGTMILRTSHTHEYETFSCSPTQSDVAMERKCCFPHGTLLGKTCLSDCDFDRHIRTISSSCDFDSNIVIKRRFWNVMLPKRRFSMAERNVRCVFSNYFSRVWVLDLGYARLKIIRKDFPTVRSVFQHLRFGEHKFAGEYKR